MQINKCLKLPVYGWALIKADEKSEDFLEMEAAAAYF